MNLQLIYQLLLQVHNWKKPEPARPFSAPVVPYFRVILPKDCYDVVQAECFEETLKPYASEEDKEKFFQRTDFTYFKQDQYTIDFYCSDHLSIRHLDFINS